jgi:hypothetical protein
MLLFPKAFPLKIRSTAFWGSSYAIPSFSYSDSLLTVINSERTELNT